MFKSKLSKIIVSLLRRIAGVTRSGAKRLMRAMLQTLMAMGRRARLPVAGFVLPTVTMVLLVVILLTVAITLRSFDRANTARNVRVNQQVLAAATPALDRAKAKIQYLVGEGNLVTGTPSDRQLYLAMSSYPAAPTPTNPDLYTFGDEERLVLRADLDNSGLPNPADDPKGSLFSAPGVENEALNTAWRYPVDTNNDGIFDTFTLYGIYFRTPNSVTPRPRRELDARTPPMRTGTTNPACAQGEGTVASLVGDSGWERISGRLQKSFFVYTVNVPITQTEASTLGARYQAFPGTPSISALEYQQDQSRIPLSNNAVVYEDDLDISPGPPLNLNGRMLTNSNLLVSGLGGARNIKLFEVSSKQSCFYDQENSRIVVGGNVVNGWSGSNAPTNPVEVHLFKTLTDTNQPNTNAPAIDTANQSVADTSLQVLYNNNAYSERLAALVAGQIEADPTGANDPVSVQQAMLPPKSQSRDQALQDYFRERLRKVTFAEAPLASAVNGKYLAPNVPNRNYRIQDAGNNSLRPADNTWSLPNGNATVGATGGAGLTIRPDQLPAENPEELQLTESENFLGNRVTVGNNLPALRWNGTSFTDDPQQVDGTTPWQDGGIRTRTPQVTKLADVGATARGNGLGEAPGNPNSFSDGFWEKSAAERPRSALDGVGGLRVITSAGVYDRTNSFLPPPTWIQPAAAANARLKSGPASRGTAFTADNTYDDPETPTVEQYRVVWPDSMPMSPLGLGSKVWDNGSVAAGPFLEPGTRWVDWNPIWSPPVALPALPDATALPAAETNPNFVNENLNPANRKFAKGDLRMRATAVYHYADNAFDPVALAPGAQPVQTPLACVSSYYDPSNASTARNISPPPPAAALPDVSGQGALAPEVATRAATLGRQQAFIGSNNGITYGPPTREQPRLSNLNAATGLLGGGDAILEAQANMVFPDGRFANGPLRTALQVAPAARTLAQQAAIDSTNCALQILDGTIGVPQPALIPHGAIQEVAFVNGREVKAIDRDDTRTIVNEAFTLSSPLGTTPPAAQLTATYNQPLEEREPLEIRATQLDINLLRGTRPQGSTTEWLLPNSGIIYASRDDALPDRSSRSNSRLMDRTISPGDNLLDPTRKPNGIVLINGQQLFRGGAAPTRPANLNAVVIEKGLTLVSNLPAYIKGTFNLHGNLPPAAPGTTPAFTLVEEFETPVDQTWGNFYTRGNRLNSNFACRAGDPRLPDCTVGDFWRPATVLADAVTLLSRNYRFGFRNEGDFDLRNNAGAAAVLPRRQQGFFNNNFVTNGLSSGAFSDNLNLRGTTGASTTQVTDATYVAAAPAPRLWSSYFNNFVTPVQRRGNFPHYLMEVCTKIPVAACTDADWFVDPEARVTAAAAIDTTAGGTTTYTSPVTTPTTPFKAGSTVDPPVPTLQRFPRRVAFLRTVGTQALNTPATPQPLGISGTAIAANAAARTPGSLWFAGRTNTGAVNFDDTSLPYVVNPPTLPANTRDGANLPLSTLVASTPANSAIGSVANPAPVALPPPPYNGSQPQLLPVPQIQTISTATAPGGNTMPRGAATLRATGWIPRAVDTTFNLIIGSGDTPSRTLNGGTSGDFNGGLQNLPRFLENWNNGGVTTNIRGSFIQQNRSAFSTAPYQPILPLTPSGLASLFELQGVPAVLNILNRYNTETGTGLIPYFHPPARNWGYDVGLLSQPPDLFTQRFTTPSTKTQPAEYFREVSRNDPWVTTLMCGTVAPDQPNANQNATSIRSGCPT
ncbi:MULTISPECIES: hormogonium polysaccharide biosynthesis protein HpsA [unclassified Microcoleus]|uniref:hormogonium polysaccharide biosynthesis protein HpsA n=1 Tax=unclassified Microcoleus TaxID=2642155 RepID=UPI002FD1ACBE